MPPRDGRPALIWPPPLLYLQSRSCTPPSSAVAAKPVTYADLGGIESVLSDIRELIEYPLKHPEVCEWQGGR